VLAAKNDQDQDNYFFKGPILPRATGQAKMVPTPERLREFTLKCSEDKKYQELEINKQRVILPHTPSVIDRKRGHCVVYTMYPSNELCKMHSKG
jgi:hypothetical protein